ncbi:MAG TPA: PEGA domain-containing protein [Polyangia bacterium]|nr:PEGA domain-containing protein [Polyangia bacterium]
MKRALLAFVMLATAAGSVSAQEEPTPTSPPAATVTNGPQPVRVTTFLMKHPGLDDQALVPVLRALDEGLKRNPRLEMKDLDTRLADFAQEVPQEQIDEGRLLLQEGQKALTALDLPTAIKKLNQAVEVLSKVLPYVKKQELADAMMALGAAHFENADKKEAKRTFERLLVWRSDYKVDLAKYPPTLLSIVEEVRKEVERQKRGSLEIRSQPAAAQAYVDGRYIGVTPTFADGLITGEHWVTLKKEGFKKAVMPAQVSSKVQQLVSITMERSTKYLLVEQALAGVEKSLGEMTLDASADNLKEVLFIDHAVFVRAAPAGPGAIKVDSFLYDLRTRRRLTRVTKTVAVAKAEKDLSTLASALYLNVSYEAELVETKDAPPPKPYVRPPFYKTWWFWTAAGVAVTGVVLGATLAPRPKDCGSGNFCFGVVY